jgi:GAF domain-containing protein
VLRERRGTWYDAWVVDAFLSIVDKLEREENEDQKVGGTSATPLVLPAQLEVITATTAEEREFNELRRELPLAPSLPAAAEVLFNHLRRVVPANTFALFVPDTEKNELVVAASQGIGSAAVEGLCIATGDRISGWALAHKQAVLNSNAALELGPIARTFATPLRYALAVPILNGPNNAASGVITAYASEPFDSDHRRMLESAATLFGAAVQTPSSKETRKTPTAQVSRPAVH